MTASCPHPALVLRDRVLVVRGADARDLVVAGAAFGEVVAAAVTGSAGPTAPGATGATGATGAN